MTTALKNRYYLTVDIAAWCVLPSAALALRLDAVSRFAPYVPHLVAFTLIAVAAKVASLWTFGLYRRYWRYASIDELVLIIAAVAVAGLVTAAGYRLGFAPFWDTHPMLPRSVPILDSLLTVLYVGGTRFAPRSAEHFRHKWGGHGRRHRVLIAGAGRAGTMIARQLAVSPQLDMEPVGFVDDDGAKHGRTIAGLRVLGGRERLAEIAREHRVALVIIAMPTAPGVVVRQIMVACGSVGVQVKTVPSMFETLYGRLTLSQLRDVRIEDLLRRPPVRIDRAGAAALLRGATVAVTGAGGSIGSEICRQVAHLGAAHLVLVGRGENSIFEVYNSLRVSFPGVELTPIIADVRNLTRLERVFAVYRPALVFHAAAHKHVPMMEGNPEEAVTNNVMGTRNALTAAEAAGVDRFVLISSDKAVNPANVMGQTKLLAEQLVHDAGTRNGRQYVSVRFGNVLASRGSVVPLFQQQIRSGGPITVTHPDMTRYFMTIPEAVQLVLQAAVMGRGGETFILDMGDPVRVVDLAEDIIRLSGLEVGRDIEIAYTGLREGEKLREDLLGEGEHWEQTEHPKIFVMRQTRGVASADLLDALLRSAEAEDTVRVHHLLGRLLDGAVSISGDPSGARPARSAPRVRGA